MVCFAAEQATTGFLTPEIVAGLCGILGILARHYIPALKRILPARPDDVPAPVPPSPLTPPPASPVSVAARAITEALTWAIAAQVAKATAGHKLSEADVQALKALDGVIHQLLEAKP